MRELVELLQQARQEKQITLDEISNRTKIQKRYLEALEKGDLSLFAGEVYLKGTICNYAETVGLDPKDVLAVYRRLRGGGFSEAQDEPPPAPPRPRRYRVEGKKPSFNTAIAALVLALLVGAIWWGGGYFRQRPAVEPGGTADNGWRDDQNDREPKPGDSEPEPQAEVALESMAAGETVYSVRGVSEIEMKLTFNDWCWIRVEVDGAAFPLIERMFKRGEEWTATASQKIWIRIGNPEGVAMTVNAIEIETVQHHRQPHNFSFSLR